MRLAAPLALLLLLTLPGILYLGLPRRGFGLRREVLSLICRCVLVLCLALALAGLELTSPTGKGSAL